MRLRPYKSCDAKEIEKWIKDKGVFQKWGGERFGEFLVSAGVIDGKYRNNNGDCAEKDNFYPWTAIDENNEPAHRCYKKTGFTDVGIVKGEPWNVIEMEIARAGCRK